MDFSNVLKVRKNLNFLQTVETDFALSLDPRTGAKPVAVCVDPTEMDWIDEVLYKYHPKIYLYFIKNRSRINVFRRKYLGEDSIEFHDSGKDVFDLRDFINFIRQKDLKYIDILRFFRVSLTDSDVNALENLLFYKYIQYDLKDRAERNTLVNGNTCLYELPGVNVCWEKKMKKIYIRDNNFFSDKYPERPNKYFQWVWDKELNGRPITVFTDSYIREVEKSKSAINVAWLIEPPVINSFIYDFVRKNYDLFNMIFTFDERLVGLSPKIRYVPYGTTWIHNPHKKVYNKTKLVSAVFSSKNFTEGHHIRHQIFRKYSNLVNFYGSINNRRIDQKIEGLRDYAFSAVVENWNGNSYFSEKLLDCLMTGTIPIYWGFPKYKNLFNPDGFIYFTNISELREIMSTLSMDLYERKLSAVKDNFNRAFKYIDLEEHLWKNGLKEISHG